MRKDGYVPVEKLLEASDGSLYRLAVLAAKRAMQLADGEKALIEKPGERVLDNALREIAAEKIKAKPKKQ
jgi:DNA-directed RNA polymerase omega subunit